MDQTRERLIDAAGEVFADKGFEGATVREICERAGANIAAVNYHFGDKEKLYLEAVHRAKCCQYDVDSEPPWPEGLTAEQSLREFIRRMMEDMLDRDTPNWHIELMMREMGRPTAACEEVVREFIGPRFEFLVQILDGLLPSAMTLADRHLYAFSVIGQCLLYRYHRPVGRMLIGEEEFQRLFDVERLTDHIHRVSCAGLAAARESQQDRAP